nr:PhoH family protein [Rickettsiaceae bacterium]
MSKSEAKAFKGPVAKTENQRRFLQSVHEHDITIVQGTVGVGKSFLATGLA